MCHRGCCVRRVRLLTTSTNTKPTNRRVRPKPQWFLWVRLLRIRQKAHELTPEKLKQRDVVHIDIANDPVSQTDYRETEDPTK